MHKFISPKVSAKDRKTKLLRPAESVRNLDDIVLLLDKNFDKTSSIINSITISDLSDSRATNNTEPEVTSTSENSSVSDFAENSEKHTDVKKLELPQSSATGNQNRIKQPKRSLAANIQVR